MRRNVVWSPVSARLGNSLLSYMMGVLLASRSGALHHVRGNALLPLGIRGVSEWRHAMRRLEWWMQRATIRSLGKGRYSDVADEVDALRGDRPVVQVSWPMKIELDLYAPVRSLVQRAISTPANVVGYGEDHLVVHVRLEDISSGRHAQYSPLPVGWYRYLESTTGKRLVFMGQLDDGVYSSALRRAFPSAEFRPMGPIGEDFETIRHSRHIAVSISTFALLAAWLSDSAATIHLPMWGIFDPDVRKDIHVLPRGDERFVPYRFRFEKTDANAPGNPLLDPDDRLFDAPHRPVNPG